jgi:predicted metal-dependent peptidase
MAVQSSLTPEQRVKKAIIVLQDKQPFFAHLSLACQLIMLEDVEQMRKVGMPYPTFGVDAKGRLFFHVDAVMEKTNDEILGTLVHEILHICFEHPSSLRGRNRSIANYAQDIVVNMFVWSNGFVLNKNSAAKVDVKKDEGYIYFDKTSKNRITIQDVSKKHWINVYDELITQWPQNLKCPNCGGAMGDCNGEVESFVDGNEIPCSCDDWHDYGSGDELSPAEQKEIQEFWQNRVCEAATIAKQSGKVPVGMDRLVDELMKPKVKWKDLLKQATSKYMVPVELAYHKMHKKSHQLGVYLPGQVKETKEIQVIVDTSGSIGGEELKEFLSEIVGMAKSNNRIKMGITFVDCRVHNHYEISNGSIPKIMAMTPQGGGGTQMEKGIDWVKENYSKIPVVIVLTDGYDSYNRKKRDYPFDVIWCISESGVDINDWSEKPSYGKIIKIGR